MRINQKIMKTICPPAAARLFRSDRSGAFFNHLRQVALTAVMFAVVVMLATTHRRTSRHLSTCLMKNALLGQLPLFADHGCFPLFSISARHGVSAEPPLRNKLTEKGVLNYESPNENESTHHYNGEPSSR
jgi:hypothetical protein